MDDSVSWQNNTSLFGFTTDFGLLFRFFYFLLLAQPLLLTHKSFPSPFLFPTLVQLKIALITIFELLGRILLVLGLFEVDSRRQLVHCCGWLDC